jgi:hypothetical protein
MVEEVVQQFSDTTDGAVADESETEDQLAQPGLGDGQPVQPLRRIGGRWGKGVVDGRVGLVELLVDELAADVVVRSDQGDGDAGKGVEGQFWRCGAGSRVAALAWGESRGRMSMPGAP